MVSGEGLDAYGAVTWGQFFIYQGFNDRVGWMHTSSGVDAVDEYLETVDAKDGHYYYKYGDGERPVLEKQIIVPYRIGHGMAEKKFTAYYTHHGPVIREQDGKWVTIRLMQEAVKALEQSYLRTKARSYKDYLQTMELRANSSNNTIYADADGHIAYFHGNFIPRRDTRFDFTKPVDGSNPATEWQGLLTVAEIAASAGSGEWIPVQRERFSLERRGREQPAQAGLPGVRGNGEGIGAQPARDPFAARQEGLYPGFPGGGGFRQLPAMVQQTGVCAHPGVGELARELGNQGELAGQIAVLQGWDLRWGVDSVATSLAVFWGQEIAKVAKASGRHPGPMKTSSPHHRYRSDLALKALATASDRLTADFGSWRTPWGEINRFQRLTGDIVQRFDDAQPSTPVGFTSSTWGSLASFGARPYSAEETGRATGTKKWYGTGGNSFVAVVEFGDKVHARAVTAGGESGHPQSPHFKDQVERYSTGNLREVYFYRGQLKGHTEREYHPGGS